MTATKIWAVVPVKPFETAKLRLAGILDPLERTQLARVMVEDVLDALTASNHLLSGVMVVSADPEARMMAARRGAHVLLERAPAGINQALMLAVNRLADDADSGMIVVPADLPQITSDAIEKLTRLLAAPRMVALVPATDDGGTNVLVCRPVGIIPLSFGPSSFERHMRAALAANITPSVHAWPELGRDIDRPGDLAAFLALRTATRTHDFLSHLRREVRLPATHHHGVVQTARATK